MTHYKNLLKIINDNNEQLQKLDLDYHELVEKGSVETSELYKVESARRTARNNYSTEISDYIIQNIGELTMKDVALLDYVPPRVWANVTAKARLVAQAIYQGIELVRDDTVSL